MKKVFLYLLIALVAQAAPYNYLYQPPAGTWAGAGVTGGIPTNRTQSGSTITATSGDRTSTIQTALNAAGSGFVPGNVGKYVLLGAGDFAITTLTIPPGVTLRGNGGINGTKTRLITTHTGGGTGALNAGGGDNYQWGQTPQTVSSAVTQGTVTFTIPSTTDFVAGNLCRIEVSNQQNNAAITAGATPVLSVQGSTTYNRTQITTVVSKTSGSVTVAAPGLLWDATGLTVRIKPGYNNANSQAYGVGIEHIYLDSSTSSGLAFPVMFQSVLQSWLYDVQIYHPTSGYGCFFTNCNHVTIDYSWFHGTSGGGSNGANLLFGSQGDGATFCLVQDTELTEGFPNLEVNFSSCGNVFAYNFGYDSTSSGANGGSFFTNHGPHNAFNLYEGNIAPSFECDGYFGTTSEDTIHRNFWTGVNPGVSDRAAALMKRFTRRYQVLGNRFGGSVNPYAEVGTPNIGNSTPGSPTINNFSNQYWADWPTAAGNAGYQEQDATVAASSTFLGNWYAGSIISGESLGTDVLADSLYLSSKPAFLFSLTYPLEAATLTTQSNAAAYRYYNSQANPPSSGSTYSSAVTGGITLRGNIQIK